VSSAVGTSGSLPQISTDRDLPSNLEGPETAALQAGAVLGGGRLQMIKAGEKNPSLSEQHQRKIAFYNNNFPSQGWYFT